MTMRCTLVAWMAVLGACSAPQPVSREQWEQAAARLLTPYLTEADVGCGELLIEISANFYANVGQPSVDTNLHSARKEKGPGYDETIWTNRVGDPIGAFKVTIGAVDEFTDQGHVRGRVTHFTVLHEVRLRIYTGSEVPIRLDAAATGQPLVTSVGGRLRDLQEWRVVDGQLLAR